jgi:hypothetical protein
MELGNGTRPSFDQPSDEKAQGSRKRVQERISSPPGKPTKRKYDVPNWISVSAFRCFEIVPEDWKVEWNKKSKVHYIPHMCPVFPWTLLAPSGCKGFQHNKWYYKHFWHKLKTMKSEVRFHAVSLVM